MSSFPERFPYFNIGQSNSNNNNNSNISTTHAIKYRNRKLVIVILILPPHWDTGFIKIVYTICQSISIVLVWTG